MEKVAYAKAATLGAQEAMQCADRFHVCQNLTEATQLLAGTLSSRTRRCKQSR